jgi:hypothetical protein
MAQPPSGKPSLIDTTPAPAGPAVEGEAPIRMLDALESGTRRPNSVAGGRGLAWMLAAVLLLGVCIASWSWWSQRSTVDDPAGRLAQVAAPAATAAAKLPPAPASAASAAAEPPRGATIIATPEPSPPSVVAAPTLSSVASAPAAASAPVTETATQQAAAQPPKAKPKAPVPKAPVSAREARLAAQASAERKRPAAATTRSAAAASNSDSDVALLTAVLATISRDAGPNGTPSVQAQLTIAQLVQRCEARGVKDAIETFECKRRICDGYWGKAEACPMSLSPKKN